MKNIFEGIILIGWNHWGSSFPMFWKVTKVTEKTAKAVQIRSIMIDGDGQRGNVLPDMFGEDYDGKVYTIRTGKYGLKTTMYGDVKLLDIWDGQPVFADYCD